MRTSRIPPVTPTAATSALLRDFTDRISRGSGASERDSVSNFMMIKKSHPQITQIVLFHLRNLWILLLVCTSVSAQTNSERWIDYAPVDYDIFPNVTYAKANNIELKLDLYIPRDRTRAHQTLILFHGGGWVDGQKERNVLYLLPYLQLGWAVVNVEYRTGHQSPAPAAVE